MAALYFLKFLLLICFIGQSEQDSMKISLNPEITLEGGNVTALCNVTLMLTKNFHFVVWFKKSMYGKEEEIASNEHLNGDFNQTGRYKAAVSRNTTGNITIAQYTLNISDARLTDSGEIGCKIPGSLDISKKLEVIVPATAVELITKDHDQAVMYSDGDEAVFDEDQIVETICRIKGTFPQANLSVVSGQSNDLTHKFNVHHVLRPFIDRVVNDSYYVSEAMGVFPMGYELHQKNLTCAVHYPDNLTSSQSVSVLIKLKKYLPKILCPNEIYTRPYEKDFKVICNIFSHPSIKKSQVVWARSSSKKFKYSLAVNDTLGIYKLTESPNGSRLTLTITRMFPQAFRTYRFEAWNEAGHGYHELRLVRSVPVMLAKNSHTSMHDHLFALFSFLCLHLLVAIDNLKLVNIFNLSFI